MDKGDQYQWCNEYRAHGQMLRQIRKPRTNRGDRTAGTRGRQFHFEVQWRHWIARSAAQIGTPRTNRGDRTAETRGRQFHFEVQWRHWIARSAARHGAGLGAQIGRKYFALYGRIASGNASLLRNTCTSPNG